MPKLGIVVPHYNQNETLFISVATLRANDVEKKIVVVDDGYTPERAPAKGSFSKGVEVIRFLDNQGVQVARNTGFQYLSRFKCEYTLFSDSDVIWMPGALDKMVAALDADKGASFAYCDFVWGHMSMFSGYWDKEKLLRENYISTMSVIRTSSLRGWFEMRPWNENVERLQDWTLWLTLAQQGGRGVYVQDVLFKTPLRDDGISGKGSHKAAVEVVRSHTDSVSSPLEGIDMSSEQVLKTPGLGCDTLRVTRELGDLKFEGIGNTVPVDGTTGWAKGATFVDADGGIGTTLYVNEGDETTSDFNAVT